MLRSNRDQPPHRHLTKTDHSGFQKPARVLVHPLLIIDSDYHARFGQPPHDRYHRSLQYGFAAWSIRSCPAQRRPQRTGLRACKPWQHHLGGGIEQIS